MKLLFLIAFALFIPFAGSTTASDVARKAAALPKLPDAVSGDWLIKRVSRPAGVFSTDRPGEIAIDNGPLRRLSLSVNISITTNADCRTYWARAYKVAFEALAFTTPMQRRRW